MNESGKKEILYGSESIVWDKFWKKRGQLFAINSPKVSVIIWKCQYWLMWALNSLCLVTLCKYLLMLIMEKMCPAVL